jgi:hypothetical protein
VKLREWLASTTVPLSATRRIGACITIRYPSLTSKLSVHIDHNSLGKPYITVQNTLGNPDVKAYQKGRETVSPSLSRVYCASMLPFVCLRYSLNMVERRNAKERTYIKLLIQTGKSNDIHPQEVKHPLTLAYAGSYAVFGLHNNQIHR